MSARENGSVQRCTCACTVGTRNVFKPLLFITSDWNRAFRAFKTNAKLLHSWSINQPHVRAGHSIGHVPFGSKLVWGWPGHPPKTRPTHRKCEVNLPNIIDVRVQPPVLFEIWSLRSRTTANYFCGGRFCFCGRSLLATIFSISH